MPGCLPCAPVRRQAIQEGRQNGHLINELHVHGELIDKAVVRYAGLDVKSICWKFEVCRQADGVMWMGVSDYMWI